MRKRFPKRLRSGSSGSAIVEGAVAMCMVLSSCVLATFLILNSGAVIFYKTKLTHVNYLAAQYAAAHDGDSALEEETTEFIESAMSQMNLSPKGLTVSVKPIQLGQNSAVQVTIANTFPVYGAPGTAPAQVNLIDTEIASH